MKTTPILALLPCILFACGVPEDPPPENPLVAEGGEEGEEGKADTLYKFLAYKSLTSTTHFKGLAFAGGVALQGPSVKFLIDARKPTLAVTFQNSKFKQGNQTPLSAKYHYYFAQATLAAFNESGESFNQTTYYEQSKRYFAGTIQAYQLKPGAAPLYGIQFYPEDVIAEETILKAVTVVKKAFKIAGAKLAFVATGPQQTTASVGAQLTALGLEDTTVEKILGSMLEISRTVENAYCAAKPGYHPGGCQYVTLDPEKPTALDLEYKILENGQFVCKQVREFSGR